MITIQVSPSPSSSSSSPSSSPSSPSSSSLSFSSPSIIMRPFLSCLLLIVLINCQFNLCHALEPTSMAGETVSTIPSLESSMNDGTSSSGSKNTDNRPDSNLSQALYNRKQMNQSKIENMRKLKFLMEVGKLKQIERTGWVLNKISSPERIAGHMYRMAVIPLLVLSNNSSNVDMTKVMKLSLVHDIAECIVGDFTPYDNISPDEKHRLEENAVVYLSSLLPKEIAENFLILYREYENQETPEAQLTKELDRFDMVLQAFEYEKREYKTTGNLPGLGEFFDFDRILSYIRNPELKELVAEILHERSEFLANACVQTCNQEGSLPKGKVVPPKKEVKKDKRKTGKKTENIDL